MKIAVLGTGDVGKRIASKLVEVGHEVRMGSRSADHEGGNAWAQEHGERASLGTFEQAATFAELVFNCTGGAFSEAVITSAGIDNLAGKVLIDLGNPLDFGNGFPPTLSIANDDSLAERLQALAKDAKVVKALNTVNNSVMVDPRMLAEPTTLFLCGNDEGAKNDARGILKQFGWLEEEFFDLGDITAARGAEMFLPLWVRLYSKLGTGDFNIRIVKAK